MAPIAGPQITLMMLKAMSHDLTFRINMKMDARMQLSMQSIFIGNKKAAIYQQLSQYQGDANQQGYINLNGYLKQYENEEAKIASYEKMLEMELTKLQNELKQVQAREEATQKMVDEGCKSIAGSMGR